MMRSWSAHGTHTRFTRLPTPSHHHSSSPHSSATAVKKDVCLPNPERKRIIFCNIYVGLLCHRGQTDYVLILPKVKKKTVIVIFLYL